MVDPIISHLGIAVKDLEAAIKLWSVLLGGPPILVTEVPDQKVRVAMFDRPGSVSGGRIELVSAVSAESPIHKFIAVHGEGLHHVCAYVDDIDARLKELRAAGVRLIDEIPRIGAEGHRIAFVHPNGTNGVLLELEEKSAVD